MNLKNSVIQDDWMEHILEIQVMTQKFWKIKMIFHSIKQDM